MRVILNKNQSIAGPHGCARGGETIDLPDDQAKALIQAGCAVPERAPEVERAVVKGPQETAKKGPGK
jgi:hypothetical protein